MWAFHRSTRWIWGHLAGAFGSGASPGASGAGCENIGVSIWIQI
jgi:hypothetical protein